MQRRTLQYEQISSISESNLGSRVTVCPLAFKVWSVDGLCTCTGLGRVTRFDFPEFFESEASTPVRDGRLLKRLLDAESSSRNK